MAVAQGFASIALPVIGAGSGGHSEPQAHDVILDTLQRLDAEGVGADLLVRVVRFVPRASG